MTTTVLVYNSGGSELLTRVDLLHAIRMLNRQVARVLDAVPGRRFGPYEYPRALELVRWVYAKWRYETTGHVPFSRDNVLRRDRYRCAFCGRTGTTWDHIVPRCKGGRSTWLNTVAACETCNNKRKGSKTLAEAGMHLLFEPFIPTAADIWPRHTRR